MTASIHRLIGGSPKQMLRRSGRAHRGGALQLHSEYPRLTRVARGPPDIPEHRIEVTLLDPHCHAFFNDMQVDALLCNLVPTQPFASDAIMSVPTMPIGQINDTTTIDSLTLMQEI